MSTQPRILVTSAAGKTGLPVALQLLTKGVRVRAFVRSRDHRADRLKAAGAEVFVGNQYDMSDLRKAMQGVQRAYQCAPTAPNGLHFNAAFTAAAFEAKIEHVVTLGQWLSSVDHPSLFTREVYISDILIGMRPEMSVTTINPGWFADNYLMGVGLAAHLGILAMPLGDGDTRKNAPPSNEDIARVAVAALLDPDTHSGQTYRPTGPELISPNQIAHDIGEALGRRVRYMDISEKMMLKALKAMPPSNYSEAAASQLALYSEEYRRGTFAVNAPTDAVARLGGQEPESFLTIAKRTVAARPDLIRSTSRTIAAMGGFVRMLLTQPPDLDQLANDRDFVPIAIPKFSQDDAAWRRTHAVSNDLNSREVA
ncbi:NmrA family NAD(P)-binding protein [Ruegeria sp. SCPT10]|uniref:NmrA family NAD(P)-binding protein n=1 Tax=Ruegeria sp. SCP10 TaxID=3141377 RepID=UPI00333A68FA